MPLGGLVQLLQTKYGNLDDTLHVRRNHKYNLDDAGFVGCLGKDAMTPQERERMNILVARIQEERDPKIFGDLVAELNQLISVKSERIQPHPESTSKSTVNPR